jgi:hypothetical protein
MTSHIALFLSPLLFSPLLAMTGYGTHFAFLYVGTPPVRQAVIIDTGSSFTAFPCLGCNKCGQHVSKYFDPEQSTSAVVQQCGQKKKEKTSRCTLNEHYSEGSSWEAYKVSQSVTQSLPFHTPPPSFPLSPFLSLSLSLSRALLSFHLLSASFAYTCATYLTLP